MSESKKHEATQADALYQWISYDLKRMKAEILQELNYSAMQLASLYNQLKTDDDAISSTITQEIRYGYRQNQSIFDSLSSSMAAVEDKLVSLENLQNLAAEISELKESCERLYALYDELSTLGVGGQAVPMEIKDELSEDEYKRISELVQESVNVHSRQVLDAVAAIPVAENVDYTRIVDEVGDRLLEILTELKALEVAVKQPQPTPVVETKIDYERIIGGTVEKVVESLPYIEKIDYARIEQGAKNAALAALNINELANAVAEKITIPAVPEIDYERLAELVTSKLTATAKQSYDVLLDEAGLDVIATKVAEKVCVQCTCKAVEEPSVEEELAVAAVPVVEEETAVEPTGEQLVERLKKSFTAKMKQSEDDVKEYYSALKNELISYRKINSASSSGLCLYPLPMVLSRSPAS